MQGKISGTGTLTAGPHKVGGMARMSEEPLEPGMLSVIRDCAGEGFTFLGIDRATAEAKGVVEAIDAYVRQWQSGQRRLPPSVDPDDVPYTLGSLWGEQVIGRFGWAWAMVTLHEQDDARAPAVVSPDRAWAIYPIHFLADCLQDETMAAPIALSFNLLDAGAVGDAEPGGYLNLMETAKRIASRE